MKIFIEVKLVGNGRSYEFEIADTMKVCEVKEKIIKEILDIEENKVTINQISMLCQLRSGTILDEAHSLKEQNVKTGDELLLL